MRRRPVVATSSPSAGDLAAAEPVVTLNTRLAAVVLFSIVAVEFGGWSLLGYLTGQDRLTELEERFFRAGHAHAGVLLILALSYLLLMERTPFRSATQRWLSHTLLIGILLQSGGFFVHVMVGEPAADSIGTWLTRAGAILLAIALVGLGMGLLRRRRPEPLSTPSEV